MVHFASDNIITRTGENTKKSIVSVKVYTLDRKINGFIFWGYKKISFYDRIYTKKDSFDEVVQINRNA